jgi:hypothetical protein
MRKLVDLYFNYDVKSGEYLVSTYANMKESEKELVEDLMRDFRVKGRINNACKNINTINKTDKDVEIAKFDVNLNSSISSASNIKVVITLLKANDESDMMVSLYSLVTGPTM